MEVTAIALACKPAQCHGQHSAGQRPRSASVAARAQQLQSPAAGMSGCSKIKKHVLAPAMLAWAGDKGLEIAPGKDVEENEELDVVGNAYNAVPVAKKWIPVDPRPGCITVSLTQLLASVCAPWPFVTEAQGLANL